MSLDDIHERAATLNTQLRFGKHKEALREAYKLRLFIQTCPDQSTAIQEELQAVEEVIELLERRKSGRFKRTLLVFLRSVREAFERSEEEA